MTFVIFPPKKVEGSEMKSLLDLGTNGPWALVAARHRRKGEVISMYLQLCVYLCSFLSLALSESLVYFWQVKKKSKRSFLLLRLFYFSLVCLVSSCLDPFCHPLSSLFLFFCVLESWHSTEYRGERIGWCCISGDAGWEGPRDLNGGISISGLGIGQSSLLLVLAPLRSWEYMPDFAKYLP